MFEFVMGSETVVMVGPFPSESMADRERATLIAFSRCPRALTNAPRG